VTRFARTSPAREHPEESPWKLGGLTVRALGRRVLDQFGEDEVVDRAAALSYYFLFALFPALLFLTTLLGLLPLPDLMGRLMGYLERVLPGDSASLVQRTLTEVVRGAHGGLLSVGALMALWAGSNGMVSIITSLNVAYDVTDPRPWWRRRLVAIALTLLFSVLTMAALVLLVFGGKIGEVLGGWVGLGPLAVTLWNVLQWPVAAVLALLAISLVYYLAPAAEQRWRWVTPGSATALVLWLAISLGFRLYVSHFGNYNATYGSIGGVILLMTWLYLSGLVLLLGAEINSEIQKAARARAGEAPAAEPAAAPVPVRPPVSELEANITVAGRAVERQLVEVYRRGWVPYVVLAAGSLAGMLLSRRPVDDVTRRADATLRTALHVSAAIAALERFRGDGDEGARGAAPVAARAPRAPGPATPEPPAGRPAAPRARRAA
jgi:membrane protein